MKNGIEAIIGIEIMSHNLNSKNVVVTGAAGYIGGITCIELKRKGYNVFGVDKRYTSHLDKYYDEFYQGDFIDYKSFLFLKKANPTTIIHCAGSSLVDPSFISPGTYFDNNIAKTNRLLDFIKDELIATKFIFSSSAAVYGNWSREPYREYNDTFPVSPYGETKLMVEKILSWYHKIFGLKYVSLRYFNACGADFESIHGQEPGASHIFAKLFECALNDTAFTLYGSNYHTKDQTCIRDYLHVSDIAEAHIQCIENDTVGIYNLGTLKGTSNLECLEQVEIFLNKNIVVNVAPKREGDPAILIADPTKFQIATGWKAQRSMAMIVKNLHQWYQSDIFKKLNKRS